MGPAAERSRKRETHKELLLFSLPRLASFGGSDASRDSFPAPNMRASKRLSFLNVLESVPAIAAGKFSIANPSPEISMINPALAHRDEARDPNDQPVESRTEAERAKAESWLVFRPDQKFKFDGNRLFRRIRTQGSKGQGSSSTTAVERKQINTMQLLKSRKTRPSLLFLLLSDQIGR